MSPIRNSFTGLTHSGTLLLVFVSLMVHSQNQTVTIGDDTFLPQLPGKVINRIAKGDVYAQRIFSILLTQPTISAPVGYEVEAYSDGNNRSCTIYFLPYILIDNEIVRSPGSSIHFSFNDVEAVFGQSLQPDIGPVYTRPVRKGEWLGYPVYEHEGQEVAVMYKGEDSLFLPVTQEEYLTALIKSEEKKQSSSVPPATEDEYQKEIQKAYQELLKTDKKAAAEFKKEMDEHQRNSSQGMATDYLSASYKKEFLGLSAAEKKSQAYYALFAIEKLGSMSGLVPESDSQYAQALVKPNFKSIPATTPGIHLIVLRWKFSTIEKSDSPRLYTEGNRSGYGHTDAVVHGVYTNENCWKRIEEVLK